MKYLKYFENNNFKQPFYLSKGDVLYISDEIGYKITPTLPELLKKYSNNIKAAYYTDKCQDKFFRNEKTDKGFYEVRNINSKISVPFHGIYSMNLIIKRRPEILTNQFGNFQYYIGGYSGDSEMHGKNMIRATRECNLNLMIKIYPIVEHIKDFYKKFKLGDKGFLDIIKNELDNNINLAKYGIPKEIKHLYDENTEDAMKMSDKYNL